MKRSLFLVRHKQTGLFWQKHRQASYKSDGNYKGHTERHCTDFTDIPGRARIYESKAKAENNIPKEIRDQVEVVEFVLVEVFPFLDAVSEDGNIVVHQTPMIFRITSTGIDNNLPSSGISNEDLFDTA